MTCSSSCFSDGESLYKSIKKRGIVIREASGRVCLHSSCTLICQSGRVCTISWKWWDVIEMSYGIVKNKCVWGGVESWVTGLQESVPLIASQPIGETEWYPATLTERGGGRRNSSQFSLSLHPVLQPQLLQFFGNSPRGRCFLAARQYAILASLEGFDAWCETKWISFGERRSLILKSYSSAKREMKVCCVCVCVLCECVWVRRQWKMAGNKHFWHTGAPIHIPLKVFLRISHILIPLVHILEHGLHLWECLLWIELSLNTDLSNVFVQRAKFCVCQILSQCIQRGWDT